MSQINHITKEGYEKVIEDLALLRAERPKISAQIAEARDKGDLSENAEYDAAKEAQGLLEMRIAKMEAMVASLRIIDPRKMNTSVIQIFNKVKIKNLKSGQLMEYTLVSDAEANLREGKLSINTPIGKALVGKKVGAVIEITVPSGVLEIEVLEISL